MSFVSYSVIWVELLYLCVVEYVMCHLFHKSWSLNYTWKRCLSLWHDRGVVCRWSIPSTPAKVYWPGIGKPSNPQLCSMTGYTTFHCIVLGSGRYTQSQWYQICSLFFLLRKWLSSISITEIIGVQYNKTKSRPNGQSLTQFIIGLLSWRSTSTWLSG